jgi:phosphoribosylanthranilate isomerase
MVRVKVCGITRVEDALAAVRFGADMLGFIFAKSPRQVSPEVVREIVRDLPPVLTVGVFVNSSVQWVKEVRDFCGLDAVQLHGEETEDDVTRIGRTVFKAVRVGGGQALDTNAYPTAVLLLDTYSREARGGTGKTFDWSAAVEIASQRPIILAGGLTPENVTLAVETVHPFAVDVAGGTESEPGRKDYEKLERFIRRAKAHERSA